MGTARRSRLPRPGMCCRRLERSEQWPAQQRHLLPSHDRPGPSPQCIQRGLRRGRTVLISQFLDNFIPVAGKGTTCLPRRLARKRRVEWPHLRRSGAVVQEYPARTGSHVDGITLRTRQRVPSDISIDPGSAWLRLNMAELRMPCRTFPMQKCSQRVTAQFPACRGGCVRSAQPLTRTG